MQPMCTITYLLSGERVPIRSMIIYMKRQSDKGRRRAHRDLAVCKSSRVAGALVLVDHHARPPEQRGSPLAH